MATQDEDRIRIGRELLLEDALWMGDVITSALRHEGRARIMSMLLLSGHVSRIVYEGRQLLTSQNPDVALPALVTLLPDDENPSIARARHATKMLDNQTRKDKPLAEFEAEIHQAWMSQREILFRSVRRGFTWLQPDLGFYTLDGRAVGATIPLHMRYGLDTVQSKDYPDYFSEMGEDLSSSIRVYTYLSGSTDAMVTILDVTPIDTVADNDKFVTRYLGRGYDRHLTIDQKLLLLLIESEVNTATVLIPLVTGTHTTAAFRARLISLWHGLSSLTKILDATPAATSPARDKVRDIVTSADARRLATPGMQIVRNRSVHYEIRGKTYFTFTDRPMFGIIESVTGETYDSVDTLVRDISTALSAALVEWREQRSRR